MSRAARACVRASLRPHGPMRRDASLRHPRPARARSRSDPRASSWARRASQVGFFALFMYFLFQTAFRGTFAARRHARPPAAAGRGASCSPIRSSRAMTLLSTHTVYRGLALVASACSRSRSSSAASSAAGSARSARSTTSSAWIFPSRYGRGDKRVEANKTHAYQRAKYYLLYAFLVGGRRRQRHRRPLRSRSASPSAPSASRVIPAAQYLARRARSAPAHDRPRARSRSAADHAQDFLAGTVWQIEAVLLPPDLVHRLRCFVAILFMNRFIPRFWCRVLCPLGAFLGVFARFALFGMEKDHAKCTDCNLCLVHCQGADSPAGRREVAPGRVPHVHELRERLPGGRDQVPLPAEPARAPIVAPDTERRTALAAAGAGAAVPPGRARRRRRSTSTTTQASSARRARSRSARSSSAASAAPSA